MASATPRTSSHKILSNSFWYGLEQVMETVVFFGTSIVVARAMGPEKLGYFSFINLFVSVITNTGGNGLASATRKYMSEFIGQDRVGVAHSVYRYTWRFQFFSALLITALGVAGVWFFGNPSFRLMSAVLLASILPGMMSWIPAQANASFENMQKNTISALGYVFSYAAVILLSLYFHWDLVGIAAATLVGRVVEAFMRTIPLEAKLRNLPREPLPPEVVARIREFCIQAVGIQLLTAIVWNRSELIFLDKYSTLTQMGFYSVSAGLASKLLLIPRTLAAATGVTLMVEASRDRTRVKSIVNNAARYLLLIAVPVHLGAAAIASQAIRFAYGARYVGAIPTMVVASVLALPLALQEIPETLMRAADRQKVLLKWLVITGVVNVTLDWVLIPRYGALGAAWGNGISQAFGFCAVWIVAQREYPFKLPRMIAVRLGFAGLAMAGVAYEISSALPGAKGLILAGLTSAAMYVLLVKLVHGLDPSDGERLSPIGNRLPRPLRRAFAATISFVVPAATS